MPPPQCIQRIAPTPQNYNGLLVGLYRMTHVGIWRLGKTLEFTFYREEYKNKKTKTRGMTRKRSEPINGQNVQERVVRLEEN